MEPISGTSVTAAAAADTDRRQRFNTYVVPEFPFLGRICRSMSVSDAEAEDLAQDVLLRSYQAIDRFDGCYPRAWLYRIARNRAISRTRTRTRSRGWAELLADPEGSAGREARAAGPGPDAEVLERGFDALLEQALEDLSPRYRTVVELVDIFGFSYQEAAQALGIPRGTVMSRLHRGRRRLRHALSGTHLHRARWERPVPSAEPMAAPDQEAS